MGQGLLAVAETGDDQLLFADAGLARTGGSLVMAGVPLSSVAETVGTPAFVYNAESIRQRYRILVEALKDLDVKLYYAVKANSNLAVLRVLSRLGAGADLVSGGELERSLAAGFAPEDLIFTGVGKTDAELIRSLEIGIGHLALESFAEFNRLQTLVELLDRPVRVAIRVNPEVTADTHPYISTGGAGIKFGVPLDEVAELARRIERHPQMELVALAMHLGSQLTDPEPYRQGIRRLADLRRRLADDGIESVRTLDLGGGLGIRYHDRDGMPLDRFGDLLREELGDSGTTIALEPGRYLVGSAGVLLTRVLYRKHSGGRDFAVVDAGLNDFVRPSLYQAHHAIVELEAQGRPAAPHDVVGPICETGDFFALQRPMPRVEPGERIAILGAGAYGFAMSSNYNSRPRAAEVLVDDGRFGIARERETVDDLFRLENPNPIA